MANEDVQKTLKELSRDLQESKARLEEAQRVAHSRSLLLEPHRESRDLVRRTLSNLWVESSERPHRHGDLSRNDPP